MTAGKRKKLRQESVTRTKPRIQLLVYRLVARLEQFTAVQVRENRGLSVNKRTQKNTETTQFLRQQTDTGQGRRLRVKCGQLKCIKLTIQENMPL